MRRLASGVGGGCRAWARLAQNANNATVVLPRKLESLVSTNDPTRGRRRKRLLSATKRALRSVWSRAPAIPDTATIEFVGPDHTSLCSVEADTGETLLRIAKANGVDISSYCGGQCSCGTCRVQVLDDGAGLTPHTPNEKMVLGDAQVRTGERLACQVRLVGPARIQVLDLF